MTAVATTISVRTCPIHAAIQRLRVPAKMNIAIELPVPVVGPLVSASDGGTGELAASALFSRDLPGFHLVPVAQPAMEPGAAAAYSARWRHESGAHSISLVLQRMDGEQIASRRLNHALRGALSGAYGRAPISFGAQGIGDEDVLFVTRLSDVRMKHVVLFRSGAAIARIAVSGPATRDAADGALALARTVAGRLSAAALRAA